MTMTRPFSDAETTVMPELHDPTQPIPRVDTLCAWCEIRLAAIPTQPRAYITPQGALVHAHPGCVGALRNRDYGVSVEVP